MKVLKIWDSEYPWDVRVEKVAEALIGRGHEVSLVCRNRKDQPSFEKLDHLNVFRLPYMKKFPACNEVMSFPAFFNPLWFLTILHVAKKQQVDLLLVRDLPLALCAIAGGNRLKIPVVLDMAEPYPEMLRLIYRFQGWKWRNLFLRNPFLADIVEKMTMRQIDHVIVVVEESKERLIRLGVSSDRISVVTNATVFGGESGLQMPEIYAAAPEVLKVVYLGLLGESRGLQTAIEAMPEIVRQAPQVCLYILGSGSAESLLKRLVRNKGLKNNVRFLGWVDNKNAKNYIKHADIGLIPHFSCGHWDHTIPNKLFDYMAYGIPVVASDVPPMKRIVETEACGVVFRSGDAQDCARAVLQLQNKSIRSHLGANGISAVQTSYQWKHSVGTLNNVLEKVCNDGRCSS